MIIHTPPQVTFPAEMREMRRWLIRLIADSDEAKRPRSPLSKKPDGYIPKRKDEHAKAWRKRWSLPGVCASYAEAFRVWERSPDKVEGLTFVLHPNCDGWQRARRLICLDFDKAFDADGDLYPEVLRILEWFDSYVELSRSGTGLHLFVWVECEPFQNIKEPLAGTGCRVEVLTSNPVAVTGRAFDSYSRLGEIPYEWLEQLPFFKARESQRTDDVAADIWDAPRRPLGEEHEPARELMENWEPAIKGGGRENVTFAAALRLARDFGYTGHVAADLLAFVPTTPPLTEEKLRHKVSEAYKKTIKEGTFGQGVCAEFDEVPDWTPPEEKEPADKPNQRIYSVAELLALDIKTEYLVDEVFVDKQTLIIGGGDKCFKTGIAMDLMLSAATATPFLNRFALNESRRGLIYTAEIGVAPARSLVQRILDARGVDGSRVDNLFIDAYGVPSFTDAKAMRGFERTLDRYEPQIVMIDPLYFCLDGAAVGDMYAIGGALRNMVRICSDREIWAVICHHTRKTGKQDDPFAPARLSDLYGSGVSAFARQWALVNHRQQFAGGVARLLVQFGGSATGDRYAWNLEINEGTADCLIDGRRWSVTIERTGETGNTATPLTFEAVLRELSVAPASEQELKKLFPDHSAREWAEIHRSLRSDPRILFQGGDYVLRDNLNR